MQNQTFCSQRQRQRVSLAVKEHQRRKAKQSKLTQSKGKQIINVKLSKAKQRKLINQSTE